VLSLVADATAKSYRDAAVDTPAGMSLPEWSFDPEVNPSEADFVTVLRNKRVTQPPVNATAVANTAKKPRIVKFGVRNSSLSM
jgi:hypothetical protein